jgi:hypothetical protein
MHFASRSSACRRDLNSLEWASPQLFEATPRIRSQQTSYQLAENGLQALNAEPMYLAREKTGLLRRCQTGNRTSVEQSRSNISLYSRRANLGGDFQQSTRQLTSTKNRVCSSSVAPSSSHSPEVRVARIVRRRAKSANARPNPSLNRSRNGGPSWPGQGYAVHFPCPGQTVPPLRPG